MVPKFLAVTAQERALFSQISTSRYFVTLFFSLNLAQAETVFIHPHAFPDKINHVSVWGNPGGNAPVFIGYQLADKNQNAATLFGTLALDVFQLGHGLFTVPLYQKEWPYFPRVGSQAMRGGYFDDARGPAGQGRHLLRRQQPQLRDGGAHRRASPAAWCTSILGRRQ